MINYQDIPLHIRCTNRHLIDPTYPGDNQWYKQLAEIKHDQRSLEHGKRFNQNRSSKYDVEISLVVDAMKENGPLLPYQMRRIVDAPFNTLLNALNRKYLLYQEERGAGYAYGVVGGRDE